MARGGPRFGMLPTILRGLRARVLLTLGSVLLTALAIGSAVLGPIFQDAVTNSYLVTRLNEAPNALTGLTWTWAPRAGTTPRQALDQASADAAAVPGPFTAPRARLETGRLAAIGGQVHLIAAPDACDHLVIETGACPTRPGEVLMLTGDLEERGFNLGEVVEVEAPVDEVTVVGSYIVDDTEVDHWFDLTRFASQPRQTRDRGPTIPYRPAPFVTPVDTFAGLPAAAWQVRLDRRFDAPADLVLADLDEAIATAATLKDEIGRGAAGPTDLGGPLRGDSVNDLPLIADEVRAQQATARASVTPAVISLVLVAMALLLRLLMAAADLRLPELALASLRGLSRRQLWRLGLSEPLTVLALSVPAGAVIGIGLSLGLVRWWLVPGLPLPLPWTSALSGLLVVVASVGVAFLAVGLVLRVSLSEQLTGVRRPQASGRASIVAQLVLVAAAGSVLASKLAGGTPGEPDLTDLVLPVLLALVAGLAATRVTAAAATWWTRRRPRGRSLPAFVASRAISRRQEGTLVILPVTAAIAICVFGAGVYGSAAEWRASVAATVAPASQVWLSPLPLQETVGLTHQLDPDGDHLMAASTISTLGPTYTVMDTARLESVGAWQDQWTPGLGAAEVADLLGLPSTPPTVTGRDLALTVDNQAETGGEGLTVRLRLTVVGKRPHFAYFGPFPPGESSLSQPTPYCRATCRIDGLALGGPAATPITLNGRVDVTAVESGDEPVPGAVEGAGWVVSPNATNADMVRDIDDAGGVLAVDVSSGETETIIALASGDVPADLPILRGVDAPTSQETTGFGGTSTTEFSTRTAAVAESVPFLGPTGNLIDYTMLTTDRTIYPQDTEIYVLAGPDTPDEVLAGLRDRGASLQTTLAGVQRTLDQGAYALALRLYAVVAVLVLVMALAGLFVSTAVQLPSRRRDAASLRVVGVPRKSVMSAVVRELVVVLGGTAVAGLAAGTLAQYVVLRTVTLGVVESFNTPALVAAIDPTRLVVLSVAAALLFGLVALVSAGLSVRGARGATLRESAR